MNEAPTFWETSVHSVQDQQGKHVPLFVTAEPREDNPLRGITVRAFLEGQSQTPLMTIKAYMEDGSVEVSNGYLLVTDEHYRRQGIGSIVLARAFSWAKHYHGDLNLSPFKIGSKKTGDEAEGLRRLYQAHGMVFHDPRPSFGSWFCDDLKCSQLVIPISPERFGKHGLTALDGLLREIRKTSLERSNELTEANRQLARLGVRENVYRSLLIASIVLCLVIFLART